MDSIVIISLVMIFCSVMTLGWGLMPDVSKRLIRRRIFSEVATDKVTPLTQLAELLGPANKWMPTSRYNAYLQKRLDAAGMRMNPMHFLVIQELGALTGAIVYFATLGGGNVNLGLLLIFIAVGCFVPSVWLNNRIQGRRMTISRDLPEVVDLLTLCVGAGSDFMTALSRIVREFRPCPVRDELGIVLQEVRVGKRRRDALRAFADRLKTPEASTFARTLIQVDRMGTGLAEALNILSEDMRLQRYHWAERFAQQAPMKMLIPLIFSLGASMVIVAGPILIQFLRGDLMNPKMNASAYER